MILQTKLSDLASEKIIEILNNDIQNLKYQTQDDSLASYATKIKKDEALIDWNEPCRTIFCKIRALVGWPVAETQLYGERLKIWKSSYLNKKHVFETGSVVDFTSEALSIAAIDGIINIEKLQLPGKNIVTARDFYNSNSNLTNKIKGFFHK